MPKPTRFSEITTSTDYGVLPTLQIDDLLDQEIMIHDYRDIHTQFGDAVIIRFTPPESAEEKEFLTSEIGIMKKVRFAKQEKLLPLKGSIVRVRNDYDIQ